MNGGQLPTNQFHDIINWGALDHVSHAPINDIVTGASPGNTLSSFFGQGVQKFLYS